MALLIIDPDETLDYTCSWSTWLDDGGSPSDTISSSSWAITPQEASPTAPELSSESNTTNSATVFVSNCVRGQVYDLTNKIVTAAGRTAERSMKLRCESR